MYDDADSIRHEHCAICATPTSTNYSIEAEADGGFGWSQVWVFLCEDHAPASR